ncbi:MAG: sulfate/molybdate ABC transporter ATP-binding protein [Clostridiales bacterium]|jgi:molybdate transport system ATP-binding protein|nr:sulfate/molybdate ABC transporter ATP-binding protein [Clostridiales bacterium]
MSITLDIKKRFRGFALDISFSSNGRPLGILGASGSGKSMTLKCIAGIETPDSGYIEVNGRVLFDSAKKINVRPQRRRVGYLFQSYALFPNMTVTQNIRAAIIGGKAEKARRCEALISRFALQGLEKRYPAQLSGGQQQRAALARILAYNPDMLLLDEPFSALDAYLKEALQIEMKKLLAGYEGDAILVSHNRDEVYSLCENLLVMDEGRNIASGPVRDMFQRPGSLAVARLTGCKNITPARRAGFALVEAPEWGLTLAVESPVPEGLKYIGVRAHDFMPAGESTVNAFDIHVLDCVESPFEWNYLCHSENAPGQNGTLWWKAPKELRNMAPIAAPPGRLCVAPQNVLLLE